MSDDSFSASQLRQRYHKGGSLGDSELTASQLRARHGIPSNNPGAPRRRGASARRASADPEAARRLLHERRRGHHLCNRRLRRHRGARGPPRVPVLKVATSFPFLDLSLPSRHDRRPCADRADKSRSAACALGVGRRQGWLRDRGAGDQRRTREGGRAGAEGARMMGSHSLRPPAPLRDPTGQTRRVTGPRGSM